MDLSNKPITATTALSALLHAVVFTAFLLGYEQLSATSNDIDIQLVSNEQVSSLQDDLPESEPVAVTEDSSADAAVDEAAQAAAQTQIKQKQEIAVADAKAAIYVDLSADLSADLDAYLNTERITDTRPDIKATEKALIPTPAKPEWNKPERAVLNPLTLPVEKALAESPVEKGVTQTASISSDNSRSSVANQQQSILTLLHASISSNKKYPFIAKRQRREGTATVAFVLHPDGSVRDTELVASSHANVLDRAAISAVKGIEPFQPANEYLDKAESFEIDVVFKLM